MFFQCINITAHYLRIHKNYLLKLLKYIHIAPSWILDISKKGITASYDTTTPCTLYSVQYRSHDLCWPMMQTTQGPLLPFENRASQPLGQGLKGDFCLSVWIAKIYQTVMENIPNLKKIFAFWEGPGSSVGPSWKEKGLFYISSLQARSPCQGVAKTQCNVN